MIRAKVETDYASFGVAVTIADVGETGTALYAADERGVIRRRTIIDRDQGAVRAEPTLRIEEDAARALLDALLDHFRGGSDTRQLRRDFEHEQTRVDQLLGNVMELARGRGAS